HTSRNIRTLEAALDIDSGTTRFASQTHSTIVLCSGDKGWGQVDTLGEGDAIISEDGTAPIAILVADCLPIAFTTDYGPTAIAHAGRRSEEHTSELQSRFDLVCRLLLEQNKLDLDQID